MDEGAFCLPTQETCMGRQACYFAGCAALGLTLGVPTAPAFAQSAIAPDWVEPMKQVHARFTGLKGTLACFGDSITITMAFWAPLAGEPKNMRPEMARAHALVKA